MNNSVLKTKNVFQDGLVMDFSPDNTSATTLTAALNATFITNNGNEMSLQNDMGNARVETAYLPEGYMPVGTCEFGDIIYIVSYNPLTNKSLIGCFPSPERNISSEELHNPNLSISVLDFLEGNYEKNDKGIDVFKPTGKLKTTSVKKVLIDKKKLNPGDKYIIYTLDQTELTGNADVLSNWNKRNTLDPNYVKLSIVSIEDGGKITYLDSTTKWYDVDNGKEYKISYSQNNKITGKDDIDSYRNMLNSGWSIFSSKVSGKLAILAELEIIDTFSCYYIIKDIKDKKFENLTEEEKELGYNDKTLYKEYNVWIAYSSESSNGLNPSYLCLTKSQFPSSAQTYSLRNPEFLHQQYVSSLENGGIIKLEIPLANDSSGWIVDNNINEFELGTFIIPYSEGDYKIQSPDFIYSFQITPAMDFGRLDHLAVDMTIDFNKIGTGEVNVTKWRYHNSGNTSILQYGLDIYSRPGWKVDDVSIEFYDNTGLTGIYYVNNKESYTGTFTEYLGLNGENINFKFSNKKPDGTIIRHKGFEINNPYEGKSENEIPKGDNIPEIYVRENDEWYQNDAGILYSNILYLAKITINLSTESENNDKSDIKVFYRWFWTNNMYNLYFYSINDFKDLKFELNLDIQAIFESNPNYEWKEKLINKLENGEDLKSTASTNIQYIGQNGNSNINMYPVAGLQDDYGCFTLYAGSEEKLENLEKFKLEIYLGDSTITHDVSDVLYEFSLKEINIDDEGKVYLSLHTQNDTNNSESGKININDINYSTNLADNSEYKDVFGITHGGLSANYPETNPTYIQINTDLSKCYYISQSKKVSLPLTLSAALFNNAYTTSKVDTTLTAPLYLPIINNKEDLENLGIKTVIIEEGNTKYVKFMFKSGIVLNMLGKSEFFSGTKLTTDDNFYFTRAIEDDKNNKIPTGENVNTQHNENFVEKIWNNIKDDVPQFFLVYFGGTNEVKSYGVFKGDNNKNPADITDWKTTRGFYDISGNPSSDNEKTKFKKSYFITRDISAFDINEDGYFKNLKLGNAVPFLGMKYKDGITIFNQAFIDNVDNNNITLQDFMTLSEVSTNSPYPNFAYVLYMLFSRMYTRNKKSDKGYPVLMKNFVKQIPYSTTLTKDIITKLSIKEDIKNPNSLILMSGVNFNEYVNSIYNFLTMIIDNNIDVKTTFEELTKSCTVQFTDVAKNNQLSINVKRSQIEFPDVENYSFIQYNGDVFLCEDLEENMFYIYKTTDEIPTENSNLNLVQFKNSSLSFRVFDINSNLNYIIGKNPKLYKSFTHKTSKTTYKKDDNIYNEIMLINEKLDKYHALFDHDKGNYLEDYCQKCFATLDKEQELKNHINGLIWGSGDISCWKLEDSLDVTTIETINGNIINDKYIEDYNGSLSKSYSKIKQRTSLGNMLGNINPDYKNLIENSLNLKEDLISVTYKSQEDINLLADGEEYLTVVSIDYSLICLSTGLAYKKNTINSCDLYTIKNPNLHFVYDSGLKLNESYSYDTFGVGDGLEEKEYISGYTGFLRDIVFDSRYLIVTI